MRLPARGAIAGLVGLVWLLLAVVGGFAGSELFAGLTAFVLGAVAAVSWPRVAEVTRRALARGEAWLVPGPARTIDVSPAAPEDEPEPELAARVVKQVLRTLARDVGGTRLCVWSVDRPADRVTPLFALGALPPPQPAAGSPLTWAVEERSTLRVDPAPSWSDGDLVVAPIDETRLLSVETPPGEARAPDRLLPGAEILAAVLRLIDRETDARQERDRLSRTIDFLQALAAHDDVERMLDSLARAAVYLLGAADAVVASWSGDHGVVLVRDGTGAGPQPGREFGLGDGDMAHAARVGTPVSRRPTDRETRPPLVADPDGWPVKPAYEVVIPLAGLAGDTTGIVAAWGATAPSEQGVRLLEALGPLVSLQLRRAQLPARGQEPASVDTVTGLPDRVALDQRLRHEQARFERHRRPVALMVAEIDQLEAVNDEHGKDAGDAVLREVATVVTRTVRDADYPVRYRGDALVVLMPETRLEAAREGAERVRAAIAAAEIRYEGVWIPVTVSVGVSACPERVDAPGHLVDSADVALHGARKAGRNRVRVPER